MFKNKFILILLLVLPSLVYSSPRIDDAGKRFRRTIKQMQSDRYIDEKVCESVKYYFNYAFQTAKPSKTFYSSIDNLKEQRIIFGETAYYVKKSWDFTAGYLFIKGPLTHNSEEWIKDYYTQKKHEEQKKRRASIFEQTKTASNNGFYIDTDQAIYLDETLTIQMQEGTLLDPHPKSLRNEGHYLSTIVNVYNITTIDLLHKMLQNGFYPVALNMANKSYPGGGAVNGSEAQEESLFRSSNYFLGLDPRYNELFSSQINGEKYFIPEFGVVYTPSVQIFRSNQLQGHAFIQPYAASFIASAAYNCNPNAGDVDAPQDFMEYRDSTKEKIRGVMRMAAEKGHDSIILGAYGCGAFGSDPKLVSQLFKEIFLEPEFKGQFREIAFAIINDKNGTNFAPFKEALHGMTF